MSRFLAVLFLAAPSAAFATEADLMRGQWTDVGDVTVTDDGATLTVDIAFDSGWAYEELHVAVGCKTADIPTTKKGNPVPGLFGTSESAVCEDNATYTWDLADLGCADSVVVAVHAVSVSATDYVVGDLSAVEGLPDSATIKVATGKESYFSTTVEDYGTYTGWCLDLSTTITPGVTYDEVRTISTYDSAAADWVDREENLDIVNYIMNTDWSYLGATKADVQTAIWSFIDDATRLEPGYDAKILAAIQTDAKLNGVGYEPGVDGVYAVLLVKDDAGDGKQDIQVTAVEADVPLDPVCGTDSETAWASGTRFVSSSWATYIKHALEKTPA